MQSVASLLAIVWLTSQLHVNQETGGTFENDTNANTDDNNKNNDAKNDATEDSKPRKNGENRR